MLFILIIINIILIAFLLFLIVSKNRNKNILFSNIENIELIEFQRGLKELIDELNKITNSGIKEFDAKKKEIDSNIILIDTKIKELKYLIERNQIIRQSEYKKEIAYGKTELKKETNDSNTTKDKLIKQNLNKKNIFDSSKKIDKNVLKILIDENKTDKPDDIHLKYSQIHNLINNGMPIEQISKITGLTKGEIQLIINIKK